MFFCIFLHFLVENSASQSKIILFFCLQLMFQWASDGFVLLFFLIWRRCIVLFAFICCFFVCLCLYLQYMPAAAAAPMQGTYIPQYTAVPASAITVEVRTKSSYLLTSLWSASPQTLQKAPQRCMVWILTCGLLNLSDNWDTNSWLCNSWLHRSFIDWNSWGPCVSQSRSSWQDNLPTQCLSLPNHNTSALKLSFSLVDLSLTETFWLFTSASGCGDGPFRTVGRPHLTGCRWAAAFISGEHWRSCHGLLLPAVQVSGRHPSILPNCSTPKNMFVIVSLCISF